MTVDYLPVLELSGDLFARKFDDVEALPAKGVAWRSRIEAGNLSLLSLSSVVGMTVTLYFFGFESSFWERPCSPALFL